MRGTFFQIRCNIWHEERYVDRKILLNSFSFENIFVVVRMCVKNLPQNISKFSRQGSTIFFQSEAGQVRQRWQFCKAGQAGAASFLRAGAGRGVHLSMVYMRENNANNYQFCRKAADDMEDPIAVMLKYLNVLGNISTKNNKTLVVPIPKVFPLSET